MPTARQLTKRAQGEISDARWRRSRPRPAFVSLGFDARYSFQSSGVRPLLRVDKAPIVQSAVPIDNTWAVCGFTLADIANVQEHTDVNHQARHMRRRPGGCIKRALFPVSPTIPDPHRHDCGYRMPADEWRSAPTNVPRGLKSRDRPRHPFSPVLGSQNNAELSY